MNCKWSQFLWQMARVILVAAMPALWLGSHFYPVSIIETGTTSLFAVSSVDGELHLQIVTGITIASRPDVMLIKGRGVKEMIGEWQGDFDPKGNGPSPNPLKIGKDLVPIRAFSVPYWILCLPSLYCIVMGTRNFMIQRHRRKHGLCPNCGYDLRASPERCPECGKERGAECRSVNDE